MGRLNSGIKNGHNFFIGAIFLSQKLGTDSLKQTDSEGIKNFIQCSGKSILKISLTFWNCVGCSHKRGCFWSVFHSEPYFPCRPLWRNCYQKMWDFIVHLLIYVKSLSEDVHLLKRPRKSENGIFHVWFPWNWFEFGIIRNDFWSSTVWAFQIQVWFTEFKNPKNPGIQPIDGANDPFENPFQSFYRMTIS